MNDELTLVVADAEPVEDKEPSKVKARREARDPFAALLKAFVRDLKTDDLAERLRVELAAQQIEAVEDLTPDKVAQARRAIAAALRLDGHALVAAALAAQKED